MTVQTSVILAHCDAAGWGIHPIIDVLEDGRFSLPPGLPRPSPDQLSFDRFEERFYGRVVVTIAFAAHRHLEPVLAQYLLVVM